MPGSGLAPRVEVVQSQRLARTVRVACFSHTRARVAAAAPDSFAPGSAEMDIVRKPKSNRNRIIYTGVGVALVAVATVALATLKPAAPSVDGGTLFTDSVRRGPLIIQVRRVKAALERVGMSHRMKHYPSQLSGAACSLRRNGTSGSRTGRTISAAVCRSSPAVPMRSRDSWPRTPRSRGCHVRNCRRWP